MNNFDSNQIHTIKFVVDKSAMDNEVRHFILIDYYDNNMKNEEISLTLTETEFDAFLESISSQISEHSVGAFDDLLQSAPLVYQPTSNITLPFELLEKINDDLLSSEQDLINHEIKSLDEIDPKKSLIDGFVEGMKRLDQEGLLVPKQGFGGKAEANIDYTNIDEIVVVSDENAKPTSIAISSNGHSKDIRLDGTLVESVLLDEISKLYLENTEVSSMTTDMDDLGTFHVTSYKNPTISDALKHFIEMTPGEYEGSQQALEQQAPVLDEGPSANIIDMLSEGQSRIKSEFLASKITNINVIASPNADGKNVLTMIELFSKDLKTMATILVDTENLSQSNNEAIEALQEISNELAMNNSESMIQHSGDVKDPEDFLSALYGGESLQVPAALLEILSGKHELSQELSTDFSHIRPGEIDLPLYGQPNNDIDFDSPDITDTWF